MNKPVKLQILLYISLPGKNGIMCHPKCIGYKSNRLQPTSLITNALGLKYLNFLKGMSLTEVFVDCIVGLIVVFIIKRSLTVVKNVNISVLQKEVLLNI